MMTSMNEPCRGETSVIDQCSRLLAHAYLSLALLRVRSSESNGATADGASERRQERVTKTRSKAGRRHVPSDDHGVWSAPSFINNWTINQREWPSLVVVYLSLVHPHLHLPSPSISISSLTPMQGSPVRSIDLQPQIGATGRWADGLEIKLK